MAGIGPRSSLVFLDVASLRARLKAVPLIKEANVSKLYPNRLLIEIEERQPTALWQKDGLVALVAGDGTPIDDLKDPRFQRLPLVVGAGAKQAPGRIWRGARGRRRAARPHSRRHLRRGPSLDAEDRQRPRDRPAGEGTRPTRSPAWPCSSMTAMSWRRICCRSTCAFPDASWRG